jgi:hypothetical protein
MDKNSPNFRDGRIEEATISADVAVLKIACSVVDGGEITVRVAPSQDGHIYLHLSGMGEKKLKVSKMVTPNQIEIEIKD